MEINVIPVNKDFDKQQVDRIIDLRFDEVNYTGSAQLFLLKQLHTLALHFPEEQFHIQLSDETSLDLNNSKLIPQNIALYSSKNKLILQGTGVVRFNYARAEQVNALDPLCHSLQERMDRYSRDCPEYMELTFKLSYYVQRNYPDLHKLDEYEQFIKVLDKIILQRRMYLGDKTYVWDLVQESLRLFSQVNEKSKTKNRFFVKSDDVFSIDAFKAMTHVLCALDRLLDGRFEQQENNYQKLLENVIEFKATDSSQLIVARTLEIAGISLISASCMALPFLLTLSVISPALIALGTCVLIFGGITTTGIGFTGEETANIQLTTKERISTCVDQIGSAGVADKGIVDEVKRAMNFLATPVETPVGITLSH